MDNFEKHWIILKRKLIILKKIDNFEKNWIILKKIG